MAFCAATVPEHLGSIAAINAIPIKRKTRTDIAYLTEAELQALLNAIPTTTWTGRRDNALFALTAQTGLRISEVVSLRIDSLHLDRPPAYIDCIGKGRKQRITPLTQAIAQLMQTYLLERQERSGKALFPNPNGNQLTPDAISRRLAVHLRQARSSCSSLVDKHVTVHVLRHTAAMRFLHAGIDTSVIALWLGHETTATTGVYLHADQTIKTRALERTRQPHIAQGRFQPTDVLLEWLESL